MDTIEKQKRTCSYCLITFSTKEKFNKHFERCPVRRKAGYLKDPVAKNLNKFNKPAVHKDKKKEEKKNGPKVEGY